MGLSYDLNCLNIYGVIRELEHEETFKYPVPRISSCLLLAGLCTPHRSRYIVLAFTDVVLALEFSCVHE